MYFSILIVYTVLILQQVHPSPSIDIFIHKSKVVMVCSPSADIDQNVFNNPTIIVVNGGATFQESRTDVTTSVTEW